MAFCYLIIYGVIQYKINVSNYATISNVDNELKLQLAFLLYNYNFFRPVPTCIKQLKTDVTIYYPLDGSMAVNVIIH